MSLFFLDVFQVICHYKRSVFNDIFKAALPENVGVDASEPNDVFTQSRNPTENQASHSTLFGTLGRHNNSNEYIDINVSPTSSDPEDDPPNIRQQVKRPFTCS